MKKIVVVLYAVFIVAGCSTGVTDLTTAKNEVAQYYESGAITNEYADAVNDALNALEDMDLSGKTAAIFDVDETALSNYEHIKEISFGYSPELWHEWVLKKEADAIPSVRMLYETLLNKGVHIFFITGRKHNEYEATLANLKIEGYMTFDSLIVRSQQERGVTAVEYKTRARQNITDRGYRIIMSVGDQNSDLEGENTGYKVKAPNYLYRVD